MLVNYWSGDTIPEAALREYLLIPGFKVALADTSYSEHFLGHVSRRILGAQ